LVEYQKNTYKKSHKKNKEASLPESFLSYIVTYFLGY
jgi:hypothetical protein